MPHGAPDDSNVVAIGPQYRVDDMAELAVRLGAISSIDRWGRVAYRDSFEHGMGDWQGYLNTDTLKTTLSVERPRSGGYCLDLWWDGTENTGHSVHILLDYPLAGKVGVEAYFHPYMSSGKYTVYARFYSGGTLYHAAVRWNRLTEQVEVRNESGSYVNVLSVDYTWGFWRTWRSLKIVVDLATAKYVRGFWGSLALDVAGIGIQTSGSYMEPYSYILLSGEGVAGYPGQLKIDDFLMTVYEP